jgi:hypothetical protein
MILSASFPAVTDENIKKIDFYHDFITYLTRIQKNPIKRTATGNISLTDIKDIIGILKTARETIKEHREYNWTMRAENHLQSLTQIKITAHIMRLTQNRKGRIHLTKKGENYLTDLSPLRQYEQIVLTYWREVNWDYFSYNPEVNEDTACMILQDNQENIWNSLLRKGQVWTEYLKFCDALTEYFHLHQFLNDHYLDTDPYVKYYNIEHDLFQKNLLLFNCIQAEFEQSKKNRTPRLLRFKPTPLGLHLFTRAIPVQPPDFTT